MSVRSLALFAPQLYSGCTLMRVERTCFGSILRSRVSFSTASTVFATAARAFQFRLAGLDAERHGRAIRLGAYFALAADADGPRMVVLVGVRRRAGEQEGASKRGDLHTIPLSKK